jgi:hypothetical protein
MKGGLIARPSHLRLPPVSACADSLESRATTHKKCRARVHPLASPMPRRIAGGDVASLQ